VLLYIEYEAKGSGWGRNRRREGKKGGAEEGEEVEVGEH